MLFNVVYLYFKITQKLAYYCNFMNAIKRNIPNLITLGNLCCGLIAIIFSFDNNLHFAGAFILFGAMLDFFDGLSARLLKVNSEILKFHKNIELINYSILCTTVWF